MSITNLFPNKEQFDTMNILLAAIANGSAEGLSVKNFESLQHITRLGLADKLLAVGDQIETERATSVSASVGESTGITGVTVNDTKLINALGSNLNGTFVLTYDGALWLNQIGVSVIAALCHEYVWYNRPDLRDALEGYGFGCPRVFWGFRTKKLRQRWERFKVIRNLNDIVTHVPPAIFGFSHIGKMIEIGERGKYNMIDAHRPENILAELHNYEAMLK